jgi:4-hydroxybenzoate polyprenyltransferase
VPLPRSGDELIQRLAERWRWTVYRVRFHSFTTHELPRIAGGLLDYARLMRLDRPIGIWLLLWPTLWALWIGGRGRPDAKIFIIFVAGTVLMRSAGCAINDYADRSFDPRVARTQDRPLAAGRISTLEALMLFAVLSLSALMLALQLNKSTLLFAAMGGFLAISYPGAADVPRRHLRLGNTHGIRSAARAGAPGGVAPAAGECAVGHRL